MSHPPFKETPEAAKARRLRNWILAGVLLAFVALVFLITIVRLGSHVVD